jgi:hypothetical protein
MSDTPRTDEAWDAVSRTPDGRYATDVPLRKYAFVMYGHSKQLERELAEMDSKNSLLWQSIQAGSKEQTRLKNELAEAREQRDALVNILTDVINEDGTPKSIDRAALFLTAVKGELK